MLALSLCCATLPHCLLGLSSCRLPLPGCSRPAVATPGNSSLPNVGGDTDADDDILSWTHANRCPLLPTVLRLKMALRAVLGLALEEVGLMCLAPARPPPSANLSSIARRTCSFFPFFQFGIMWSKMIMHLFFLIMLILPPAFSILVKACLEAKCADISMLFLISPEPKIFNFRNFLLIRFFSFKVFKFKFFLILFDDLSNIF